MLLYRRISRKKDPYEERYYLQIKNFNENDAKKQFCCYLNINTDPASVSCTRILYRGKGNINMPRIGSK